MIRPLLPLHISEILLARTYTLKVRPSTPPWRLQRALTLCGTDESYRHATTISTLPDDVLLEIFDFYQKNHACNIVRACEWHILAHVCQSWRQIVLASPHRLNLQILCTHGTPVRKNLGIWPSFPIIIDHDPYPKRGITPNNEDNVIAALEHSGRVSYLRIYATESQLGKIVTAMQEPFPLLTRLEFFSLGYGNAPVLPAEFLGGSAPCLQTIYLRSIPFPTLPTLLLSTSDLVTLQLYNIPRTGYISPEAMVVGLAALPRLETITIGFQWATPPPDRIHSPPVTRTVLPALISLHFRGANEYLEDLVAQIDGPQLNRIGINYLNQFVNFQVAQLSKFIDRSVGPKLTPFRHAGVTFFNNEVSFSTYRHANHPPSEWPPPTTTILCAGVDWQVSDIAQVLSQFSATLPNAVHLELVAEPEEDRTDDGEWLHLLHQFSTMKTLRVSRGVAGHVALALEDITGEMVAEVLPSLDLIYLPGQPASSIEEFVAARRLCGRPVTVIDTEKVFYDRLKSYVGE